MKKMLFFLSFCFFILILSVVFLSLRPTVTVINYSKNRLYLHFDEVKYDVEPNPEQVDRIVKSNPDIVEPGERVKLTISLTSVMKNAVEFNIGWLAGGRYSYNATGGGGQNFTITSKQGECSFYLSVFDGYNNYLLEGRKRKFCIARLLPNK
ncbi:hypothetical protein [Pantoea coffeiphila]|uniref:hypothetical protein n=1 Tax=Pantoea coffeiphila TaxID=1465635 RepID=UPI0011B04C15|nr:hypothetical protein [Pantoea coffeiphila]